MPSLLLFIAEGAQQIRDNITTRYDSAIVGITLTGLLFFHPFYFASYHLIKPRTKEEIKPAINYVREHRQNGDILYLYYASRYAFQYYSENYGFNSDDYIVGIESEDWGDYMNDLEELCGNKRVWILFSHIKQEKEKLFLAYLDSTGIRLDSFKSTGAAVYLYDLSDCLSKQVRPEMLRIRSSQQERTVYICTQKYVLTNSP